MEETSLRGRTEIVLLYGARAARGFGDGFAVIILPAYLTELGFSAIASRAGRRSRAPRLGGADAGGRLARARHGLRSLLLIGA